MKKTAEWLGWVVGAAFAIQSLVISSAMIQGTLTLPFVVPQVTVYAGWITLVLVLVAILATLLKVMGK